MGVKHVKTGRFAGASSAREIAGESEDDDEDEREEGESKEGSTSTAACFVFLNMRVGMPNCPFP